MNDQRCAMCGGAARSDPPFACAECGRPLGICEDCGWCVRLFAAADGSDCDGCGYVALSPEEEERQRPERERWKAALDRQLESVMQMQARSGPIYDIARERSRIVAAAYRTAGRPRDVTAIDTSDGLAYVHRITSGPRRWQDEPASEAEWRAWRDWCATRERLRRAMRGLS